MNKKLFILIALSFVSFLLVGCKKDESKEVKVAKVWDYDNPTTLVYDCLGGDGNVMPVLGFWSAPGDATINGQWFPEMKNDKYFQALVDGGINIIIQCNDDANGFYDACELTLDYCDKYDIGYFVTDSRLINQGTLATSIADLTDKIKDLAERHPSFAGLYILDEPHLNGEANINNAIKAFYQAAKAAKLNIHGYANMLPYEVGSYKPDPLVQYPQSIENVYGNTGTKLIGYDIYPLKNGTGMNYERYYTNISLMKKYADDNHICWAPFVSVTVSGNAINETKLPDEGELSWEVNTYLALGAKSLYYFPINSPISFYNYYEAGCETLAPFDYLGNKTCEYYYMQQINKQIQAVDEYLMKATNHGIVAYKATGVNYLINNEVISNDSFREMVGVRGDSAVIGCFDYYGKTMLYVVNDNMYGNSNTTLDFDARYEYEIYQRGVKANAKGKKVNLSLAPGESALVLLK